MIDDKPVANDRQVEACPRPAKVRSLQRVIVEEYTDERKHRIPVFIGTDYYGEGCDVASKAAEGELIDKSGTII